MSDLPPPPPPPPPPPGSGSESFEPTNYGSSAHSNEPERGWARTDTGEHFALAGAGHRFLARLVDVIVVGIPAVILISIVFDFSSESGFPIGANLTLTAIWLFYEVSMVALKGRTLGKMATRIKVIRSENGEMPEWEHSFRRCAPVGACSIISAWVPIIGFLNLLIYLSFVWDKKRQGWHDMVGKTLIVKT